MSVEEAKKKYEDELKELSGTCKALNQALAGYAPVSTKGKPHEEMQRVLARLASLAMLEGASADAELLKLTRQEARRQQLKKAEEEKKAAEAERLERIKKREEEEKKAEAEAKLKQEAVDEKKKEPPVDQKPPKKVEAKAPSNANLKQAAPPKKAPKSKTKKIHGKEIKYFSTVGDGDCGLHSMFGEGDVQLKCTPEQIKEKKQKISDQVMDDANWKETEFGGMGMMLFDILSTNDPQDAKLKENLATVPDFNKLDVKSQDDVAKWVTANKGKVKAAYAKTITENTIYLRAEDLGLLAKAEGKQLKVIGDDGGEMLLGDPQGEVITIVRTGAKAGRHWSRVEGE